MISVIICANKPGFIEECVESVKKSKDVEFDITIMSSIPDIKLDGVRIIETTGEPAKRRNEGVKATWGEYIAFFDDDVIVDENCLKNHLKHLETSPNIGMTFGFIKNAERRDEVDDAGAYLTWNGFLWSRGDRQIDRGQFNKSEPILAGKSANCMIRRCSFENAGGFDESFGILGEETDLAWRVWKSGKVVLFACDALAWHWFNTSRKTFDYYSHQRVYYNGCRNYLTMLYKNLEPKNRWKIIPFNLMMWVASGILMFLGGKREASKNIFKGILYFIKLDKPQQRCYPFYINGVCDKTLFPIIKRNPPLSYFLKRVINYVKTGLHG